MINAAWNVLSTSRFYGFQNFALCTKRLTKSFDILVFTTFIEFFLLNDISNVGKVLINSSVFRLKIKDLIFIVCGLKRSVFTFKPTHLFLIWNNLTTRKGTWHWTILIPDYSTRNCMNCIKNFIGTILHKHLTKIDENVMRQFSVS